MKKLLLLTSVSLVAISANAQTKNCLIEQFTSSTCGPCKSFNTWWDPMLESNNANKEGSGLVVVKYQEDFPNPGTGKPKDPSYNMYVNDRDQYYYAGQSWGIPAHRKNGAVGVGSQSTMQTELNNCKGGTADLALSGSYTVKKISATKDSIFISVTVTPSKALSGNYALRIAATEKHYTYPGAVTGQTEYHHVMRKMYPNATGTPVSSFAVGTPQTFTFKDEVTVGNVVKDGFNWWDNPFNGSVVAFVQNEGDKGVLNSVAIPAKWATNIPSMSNIKIARIIPNPAVSEAAIIFDLDKASQVSMKVTDIAGRVVYSQAAQEFKSGVQRMLIPTENFASGNYIVNLQSEMGGITERLTVNK